MDHTEENSGKYPLQCAVIPDYSCLKTLRKKDLSKKACQQNSSHEEEAENVGLVKSLDEETLVIQPEASYIDEKNDLIKIEEEQEINQDPEVPWGGPVSSDELSPENSDTESESTVSYQSPSASSCSKTQVVPKSHSGMILKLRKVFLRKNGRGDKILYQAVSDFSKDADQQKTETLDPTRSRGHRREMHNKRKHERSHPSSRRERRATNVSLDRLQKQSRRSMKYCPYLSTCHRADRRRWVLRSAVQIANSSYPNLVGKRIRHLYEDNDKTEVWYRGVVLRVHEPHPNPLKTVFEVKYDSEPEWQYYLELLMDYKKGWLKVED